MASSLLDFALSGIVFVGIVLGLGVAVVSGLSLEPAEKLVAAVAASLVANFVLGWIVYTCGIPNAALRIAPLVAAVCLFSKRSSLLEILRDSTARRLFCSQAIVSSWCVGLLGLVVVYSGGKLVADWFGHWQRARFFLYHWPRDLLFNGFDPLPSRPPLANVLNGIFLRTTQVDFSHYQIFSTLFSSLSFLPAGLIADRLARRSGLGSDARAIAVLVLLFLANPLFAENSTYAWTKLPTAFFVLTGVYFFLRAFDADTPACSGALASGSLAAGILTHYSAVPYALLLMIGWFWLGWPQRKTIAWRRSSATAAIVGILLLGTWFGWAAAVYGAGAFLSNTSVTDQAATWSAQLRVIALNLRDSIVPHFFGGADFSTFLQRSLWGWWRDWFFQLYQCNLFFIFGSLGWVAFLPWVLKIGQKAWRNRYGVFWVTFVVGIVVLGIAVHGGRESGGLAHICLQPLALLGLAFLAGHWDSQNKVLRQVLLAGATIDLGLGIALQFAAESLAIDHWLRPNYGWAEIAVTYSQFTQPNFRVKPDAGWIFFGDLTAGHAGWIVAGLAVLLLVSIAMIPARKLPISIK